MRVTSSITIPNENAELRAERLLDDELQRYIEYLQRILSTPTPGFERMHDTTSFRAWVENNRPQLEAIAQLSGGSSATADEMEMALALYEPRSQFDSFTAEAIFGPILATVLSAAAQQGLAPRRPILFANSTDASASAASRQPLST